MLHNNKEECLGFHDTEQWGRTYETTDEKLDDFEGGGNGLEEENGELYEVLQTGIYKNRRKVTNVQERKVKGG